MQKTSFDFEILIHDDASTDKTADIIREYEKMYPNIIKTIYQTENQYSKGVDVFSLNTNKAKGKYIAVCEGDDYWTDIYKLQRQVDYMEGHPECSMCFHAAEMTNADKSLTGRQVRPYNKNCISPIEDIIIGGGGFCATASLLYHRKLVEKLPEFYMKAHVGDYPLQMFLASKGYVYYIDKIMSVYRIGVQGSWTDRALLSGNAREKFITNYENDINLLNEFNKYTNCKYLDAVMKKTLTCKVQILLLHQDIKEIKKSKYMIYYNELALKRKIKLYAKFSFPSIYEKLGDIKRGTKQFKWNIKSNLSKTKYKQKHNEDTQAEK